MAKKDQYQIESAEGDSHIIHLKNQVNVIFDEKYEYYIKSKTKRFFSKVFVTMVYPLFSAVHYLMYGVKVKDKKIVKNLRRQKTAFVSIANHCLMLDSTISLAITFPRTTYMPTVEPTMKIPVARHILRAGNVTPIPLNVRGLVKFKKDCEQILKDGKALHYFPEGALWPFYGRLREFKPGAFRFAVDANVPILPLCFYFRPRKGLFKILGKKPLVTVQVLEPIYPNQELAKKAAINDLLERSHAAMQEVIDKHPYDNPQYAEIEKQLGEKQVETTDNQ